MAKKSSNPKGSKAGLWWIVGLVVLAVIALVIWSGAGSADKEIPGLQSFADEGNSHVANGAKVTYKTDPPTSGPHYGSTIEPAFYTKAQAAGDVVHALEHGHVVIYYDPADAPSDLVETLRGYTIKYNGHWDGVIVMPRSQSEAVVLTAWRKMLPLQTWDKALAERFIDAFRGRGPENPVR